MALQLSVVVPCHNEMGNVAPLVRRTLEAIAPTGLTFELILVDDGSRDSTFAEIRSACAKNPSVRGIRLSRNFGHQPALLAGLKASSGATVVSLDADLQHPPELIPEMLRLHKEGAEIVQAIRNDTAGTPFFKRWTSQLFYQLLSRISTTEIPAGGSDFRLLSRPALDALLSLEESDPFLRGMVQWIGFEKVKMAYTPDKRNWGKTQYPFKKMVRFALQGIVGFSERPLYFSFYFALALGVVIGIYGIYVINRFFSGEVVPGWTSSILLIEFSATTLLFNQGIQGLYLARLLTESKGRPRFLEAERVGWPPKADSESVTR